MNIEQKIKIEILESKKQIALIKFKYSVYLFLSFITIIAVILEIIY